MTRPVRYKPDFVAGAELSGGAARLDALGRVSFVGTINNDRIISVGSGASDAHPGTAASLYSMVMNPILPVTTTTMGMAAYLGIRLANASFTMAEARCIYVDVPATPHATSLITNLFGLYIANQGNAKITNAYGLVVTAQAGAGTLNVAARLDGGTQANLWLNNDTATIAGGIAFGTARDQGLYRLSSTVIRASGIFDAINGFQINGGPIVKAGTGTPEGVVTAAIGSIWQRTDGGTDTALYRKETGAGNTGWVAVAAGGGGGSSKNYATRTFAKANFR